MNSEFNIHRSTFNVVDPYVVLARIYDQIMSHVDYRQWVDFVLDILTDYGLPETDDPRPPHLLECACGTGTVAGMLALRGCRVDAFDSSPTMIEVAESKVGSMLNSPDFTVSDFTVLDAENRYDAVLCLYDSVNYILEPHLVEDFFSRVRRSLKMDGLFLFDTCTEYNSIVHFSSKEQQERCEGFSYDRVMRYNHREMIQENSFYIRLDSEPGKVYKELHRQRIYTLQTLRDIISKSRMKILEETDEYLRRPPREQTLRVHFLCRRD